MQPLRILFGAVFTVAACTGIGARLLGPAAKDWAVRFVTGASVLSLAVFAACCLGIAYPLVFAALGAAAICLGCPWIRPQWSKPHGIEWLLLLAFAVFFFVYLSNAMAPEVSPDGATYHLGLVARYLREHGFHRITWNMYASLPEGIEMLFLFAFAFGRHSAAAVLHLAFLVALVRQMVGYGRRRGFALPAACAALLVFVSPLAGIDGTSAYNDVALAAVAFTLFTLLQSWGEQASPRLAAAIGLTAGFAFAVKYTAWPALVYAALYVLYKSRSIRLLAVVSSCAAAVFVPWLAKNWLWVQNPLAPFFNNIFPNPYVTSYFETGYRHDMALYDLSTRWQIPMQVTVHGALGGLLGPVFLLAPLALGALRWPRGRQLLLAALVFGANYFSNISPRFLLPSLPFVALAMMLVLSAVPGLAVAVALLHAAISWPTVVPRYAAPYAWRLHGTPWRAALRIEPETRYLQDHLFFWNEMRMVADNTPRDAAILTFTGMPEAYLSQRILVEYQAEPNQIAGHLIQTACEPQLQPVWQLRFRFPRQPVDSLRLVQTGSGDGQWNIHELRLFDGAAELRHEPSWRITAQPYPWNIQDAFDGKLITFWRCGDALSPGQFVELDLGGTNPMVDSVMIQAEPDQPDLHIILKKHLNSRKWAVLDDRPEVSQGAPPEDLRRAAASELKLRGIDYVLAWENERETADLRRNPDLWGVQQVARTANATLYKLP